MAPGHAKQKEMMEELVNSGKLNEYMGSDASMDDVEIESGNGNPSKVSGSAKKSKKNKSGKKRNKSKKGSSSDEGEL